MAAFFAAGIGYKPTGEWKGGEDCHLRPQRKRKGPSPAPLARADAFPTGPPWRSLRDQDPREVFADWLITPRNPWFTRTIVNRVWSWLQGRGIVHEPDDIRPDNPPSERRAVQLAGGELVAAHYDLKHVFRLILNSKTYQLSCVPDERAIREAAANFAYYCVPPSGGGSADRRLVPDHGHDGELFEHHSRAVHVHSRETSASIALPDGSITSSFLEMFGRPPRDTGLESERNNRSTAASGCTCSIPATSAARSSEGPQLREAAGRSAGPRRTADALYLTILSRFPTEEETKCGGLLLVATGRRDHRLALLNSEEFLSSALIGSEVRRSADVRRRGWKGESDMKNLSRNSAACLRPLRNA